jgi:hypothetical protein
VGVALLGMNGCEPPAVAPPGDEVEPPAAVGDTAAPPALAQETIMIEGIPEVVLVMPFEPPVGFPLGFRTVVPADMRVQYASSGEGDAVRFEAAFGGVHRPEALLSFTVLPEGLESEEARGRVQEIAAAMGAVRAESAGPPWALDSYRLAGEHAGFLALGEHREFWFYFLASYPPEFGDGLSPRIDLILRRWFWADDGTRLGAE